MWSTPTDRDRAEAALRKQKLTPAQERQKEIRATAFAAGYDAAVERFLLVGAELKESGRYARTRVDAFEQWDWARRVAEVQAKATA